MTFRYLIYNNFRITERVTCKNFKIQKMPYTNANFNFFFFVLFVFGVTHIVTFFLDITRAGIEEKGLFTLTGEGYIKILHFCYSAL